MTDTHVVRDLFDDLAPVYDREIPFFATFGADLVAWAELRPGDHVLDLGAGTGAVTRPAAAATGATGRVVAVDNAPAMLDTVATDVPGVETLLADVHALDVPDAAFDVVTCGFLLHFLDDPVRALTEIRRVLRPEGRLVLSGPPQGPVPPEVSRPDPRWSFMGELLADVGGRSASRGGTDPFTPPPRPLPELCREVGLTDLRTHLAVRELTLRDPEHYWRWQCSHGFRGFVDSLDDDLASELRDGILRGLAPIAADDGAITMRSVVAFTSAARP